MLLEEISKIQRNKIEKLFAKPPFIDLKISHQIHFIYQLKHKSEWENFQSINQYKTILELEKETVKL